MRQAMRVGGSISAGVAALIVAGGTATATPGALPVAQPTKARPSVTVTAEFTQRNTDDWPGMEKWEEMTVSFKKARAVLVDRGWDKRYKGTAFVTVDYKNHFLAPDGLPGTMDCGPRLLEGTAHWTGKVDFDVDHVRSWTDKGVSDQVDTWMLISDNFPLPTPAYTGMYHEWENTQLKNCLEKPLTSSPMGWSGPSSRQGMGLSGKLGKDGKGMVLTHLQSSEGDTYLINGWMTFSVPPP